VKRRKTTVSNEYMISETVLLKSTKASSVKRVNKSRRRFPLEDDDVRLHPGPMAEDDSFVAVLGNRKTLNKKTKIKNKQERKAEVVENQKKTTASIEDPAATVTRPRRRAAAAASSKVAEGFEEEQTSIDKKRQDPEPAKRASKSRQKNLVAQVTTQSKTTFDKQPDNITATTTKALPEKRAVTKKSKVTMKKSVVEDEVVQAVNSGTDELAENITLPMQDANTSSHEYADVTEVAPKTVSKSKGRKRPVKKRKRKSSMDGVKPTQAFTENLSDAILNTTAEGQEMFEPNREGGKTRQTWQPLAEADTNMTVRSLSPEKAVQASPKDTKTLPGKTSRQRAKILEYPDSSRPERAASRKRKLNIKLDTIETLNQNAGTESSGEHLKGLSAPAHFAGSKDAEQSSLDRAAIHKPRAADQRQGIATAALRRGNLNEDQGNAKISHSTQVFRQITARAIKTLNDGRRARPISCEARACTPVHYVGPSVHKTTVKCANKFTEMREKEAGEEDVDWLFEPESQATAPKAACVKSKSGNVESKSSKFKMPEMDLDDLLSNIASFAQDKSMPRAENMKLFAGGQQKPRSGSKKKAKP
jgi:hypothetical protein